MRWPLPVDCGLRHLEVTVCVGGEESMANLTYLANLTNHVGEDSSAVLVVRDCGY